MNKSRFLLAVLALMMTCGVSFAAAPTTATVTATKAPTEQQSRMKTCAAEYHAKNIAKAQYRSFMSGCLRTHPKAAKESAPAAKKPVKTQ